MKPEPPVISSSAIEAKFFTLLEIGAERSRAFQVLAKAREQGATAVAARQEAIITTASTRIAGVYERLSEADWGALMLAADMIVLQKLQADREIAVQLCREAQKIIDTTTRLLRLSAAYRAAVRQAVEQKRVIDEKDVLIAQHLAELQSFAADTYRSIAEHLATQYVEWQARPPRSASKALVKHPPRRHFSPARRAP